MWQISTCGGMEEKGVSIGQTPDTHPQPTPYLVIRYGGHVLQCVHEVECDSVIAGGLYPCHQLLDGANLPQLLLAGDVIGQCHHEGRCHLDA